MYRPEDTILKYPRGFAALVPSSLWKLRDCCRECHATPQEAAAHGLSMAHATYDKSVAAWRTRDA